jgi:hypothetical protein
MARIDEIVEGIYRISTTFDLDGFAFQFNQFLIDDERPALIHTGMYVMYDHVRIAVAEVLDPGRLAYVILLHFEVGRVRRDGPPSRGRAPTRRASSVTTSPSTKSPSITSRSPSVSAATCLLSSPATMRSPVSAPRSPARASRIGTSSTPS